MNNNNSSADTYIIFHDSAGIRYFINWFVYKANM